MDFDSKSIALISECLSDYQQNNIPVDRLESHIITWANQFEDPVFVVSELAHVMDHSFITKHREKILFNSLFSDSRIASLGDLSKCSFFKGQCHGNSQNELLPIAQEIISNKTGISIPVNQFDKNVLIYVDDYLFSGTTLLKDIKKMNDSGFKGELHCFYWGYHLSGMYYVFKKSGLDNVIVHGIYRIPNCLSDKNESCVMWPKSSLLEVPSVQSYLANHGVCYFREDSSQSKGDLSDEMDFPLFSSPENRDKLEKEFLIAGIKIKERFVKSDYIRPLGVSPFDGLGFGGMLFSYRNIANNTPLCLWWGSIDEKPSENNWYPLMKRRVNSETEEIQFWEKYKQLCNQ